MKYINHFLINLNQTEQIPSVLHFLIYFNHYVIFFIAPQNITTLTSLLIAAIKTISVQVLGVAVLHVRRAIRAGCSDERWDVFAIVVKYFANRRKVLPECCARRTGIVRRCEGRLSYTPITLHNNSWAAKRQAQTIGLLWVWTPVQ